MAAARAVSVAFQPAVAFTALLGVLLAHHAARLGPVLVVWLLLAGLPAATLATGLRFGLWSDVEMTDLRERRTYLPLCVVFAASGAVWAVLAQVPTPLRVLSVAVALWLAATTLVSLVWKISLHEGGIVGVTLMTAHVFGGIWLPALGWAPLLVAWARLRLGRHTPAQLAAGAAAAGLSFALALRLTGG